MAGRETTLSVVHPQQNPAAREEHVRRSKHRSRGPKPPMLTLREAFGSCYSSDDPRDRNSDVERGLRSVAFLMDSLSEAGGKDLDGDVAFALANVVRQHADYLGWRAGRNDYDGPIFGSPDCDGRVQTRHSTPPGPVDECDLVAVLRDVFARNYVSSEQLNCNSDVERGLRSAAFLMDSLSEAGGKDLDGDVAFALASVVRQHADYLGWRAGRNDYDGPIFGSPEADRHAEA